MRYIADSGGYVKQVSFGADITCDGVTCTEYTGSIPTGYASLESWYLVESEKLYRWKVVNGNLTLDSSATEPWVDPRIKIDLYENNIWQEYMDRVGEGYQHMEPYCNSDGQVGIVFYNEDKAYILEMSSTGLLLRYYQNGGMPVDYILSSTGGETPSVTLESLGITATADELNKSMGVGSNIQDQLDDKVSKTNGGTISKDSFSPLRIKRPSTTYAASIAFENKNGLLGHIGMNTVDGAMRRYSADGQYSYNLLDSSNYGSYAAPTGYGLGTYTYGKAGLHFTDKGELDNLKSNGWWSYRNLDDPLSSAESYTKYGMGFTFAYSNSYIVQIFYPLYINGVKLVRMYNSENTPAWTEWMFENPSLRPGVEYPTAEKWDLTWARRSQAQVYTQVIDCGAAEYITSLGAVLPKTIDLSGLSIDKVLRVSGCIAATPASSQYMALPYGGCYLEADVTNLDIYAPESRDGCQVYAQIWYTKTS